jgi:hypothetical protein
MSAHPAISTYHPASVNPDRCLARRTNSDLADRRWYPFVFTVQQCQHRPVRDSDLCDVCERREAAAEPKWTEDGWHGRVTDAELPPTSHFAGSAWFHTKAKWRGTEKPLTAKQNSPRHEATKWNMTDVRHFIMGTEHRDIHRAIQENLVGAQLLRDGVCTMLGKPDGATRISYRKPGETRLSACATRPELAELILLLKRTPVQVNVSYTPIKKATAPAPAIVVTPVAPAPVTPAPVPAPAPAPSPTTVAIVELLAGLNDTALLAALLQKLSGKSKKIKVTKKATSA